MSELAKGAIGSVLLLATLAWLVLLLASTLFPPPRRRLAMRPREIALVVLSGVLLLTWTAMLLATIANT